ncbi:hypothetical protein [Bradyrhizobium sp.]|uniref:hypothetical protein n=1 Tax=Bradyrhizobium sp. TaxID=376 RepID=UPI002614F31A|nr:hypothetical protein [Bradyrhizobium sp.]
MLDLVFGLNARLGRLRYFLACIALGIVMTGVCFALVVSGTIHIPRGSQLTWQMLSWPVLGAIALFVLVTVMLQAMRVRDIGWDPVVVMAAWFAIVFVDVIVAVKIPDLAIAHDHYGTIVGSLVNLVMTGILLFWPSSDA